MMCSADEEETRTVCGSVPECACGVDGCRVLKESNNMLYIRLVDRDLSPSSLERRTRRAREAWI